VVCSTGEKVGKTTTSFEKTARKINYNLLLRVFKKEKR